MGEEETVMCIHCGAKAYDLNKHYCIKCGYNKDTWTRRGTDNVDRD